MKVGKKGKSETQREATRLPLLLGERELAETYGLSRRTCQRWRLEGRGPRWIKLHGCVRYKIEDITEWIAGAPAGGGGR